MYSVTFNNECGSWEKSRKYNVMFLRVVQQYADDLMRSRYRTTPDGEILMRGYVLLNEVFAMIGMPSTPVGACVGWLYDEKNPIGDNFVDFDINPRGFNPNVVLDFNVDGDIGGKISP
jgi:hypothetical protein